MHSAVVGKRLRTKPGAACHRLMLIELIGTQGPTCFYCGRDMLFGKCQCLSDQYATLDRLRPGSRDGGYIRGNVVLACQKCNRARGDLPVEEFMAQLRSGCKPPLRRYESASAGM